MALNFTFAPPSKLVTSFFIVGAFFYLIASIAFFNIDFLNMHYLDPKIVGFIHIFLLGFMMSVIFGAMYQLISVVLEIPLYSNQIAYMHLGLFVVSLIPFLGSFLNGNSFEFLGYGSILLYLSFMLYLTNIFFSVKKVEKKDIKAYFVITSHIILFIGVTYGLLTSLGLVHNSLGFNSINLAHKHIILVLFGFTGGLIAIMATVLLPMFMLSHNFNKKISNYLLFGIIATTISTVFGWFSLAQMLMIATILAFSFQLYDIFTKRMRKYLDVYALDMITSGIFLILLALLIPFLHDEKVLKLFMVFLILGFISSFIVGHIYKIVPFLVWNKKFAPLVGEQQVPMLSDMVHKKGSLIEFYTKLATIVFLTIGILFHSDILIILGKILFIINSLLVAGNVIYIFKYKG